MAFADILRAQGAKLSDVADLLDSLKGLIDRPTVMLDEIPQELVTIRTDTDVEAIPTVTKPDYLVPIIDPTFGTKIMRISDDSGVALTGGVTGTWGTQVGHQNWQTAPWNADESLIHIVTNVGGSPSSFYLDGSTYIPSFAGAYHGDDNRWHRTDPELKVFVSGTEFGTWNVITETETVLRDFTEYTEIFFGEYEGNLSSDGNVVGLLGAESGPVYKAFAYNIATDTKYAEVSLGASYPDWVGISASGLYMFHNKSVNDVEYYDLDGNSQGSVTDGLSHMALAAIGGEDYSVSRGESVSDGLIVAHTFPDQTKTVLTTDGYATHISHHSVDRPGWCYASVDPDVSYPLHRGEVIAVRADGVGGVERWCHIQNSSEAYGQESWPASNADGTRFLFLSDWQDSDVGFYVCDRWLNRDGVAAAGGSALGGFPQLYYSDTSTTTLVNSDTEQTLAKAIIPADKLITKRALRFYATGSYTHTAATGTAGYRIYLHLNDDEVFEWILSAAQDDDPRMIFIEGMIQADNSSAAQQIIAHILIGPGDSVGGTAGATYAEKLSGATATEDSTANMTLKLAGYPGEKIDQILTIDNFVLEYI